MSEPVAPLTLSGVVRGLHHVAIVVPSIAAARPVWEGALGLAAVAGQAGAEHDGAQSHTAHSGGAVSVGAPADAPLGVAERASGALPHGVEHVANQRVNVLVLRAGSQRIELVEPASADSPVTKFLAQSGGGVHHLAWRVDDIAAAIDTLVGAGVRMIDAVPRPGAHGTRIAFVHPKSTGGVLMELVEDPALG